MSAFDLRPPLTPQSALPARAAGRPAGLAARRSLSRHGLGGLFRTISPGSRGSAAHSPPAIAASWPALLAAAGAAQDFSTPSPRYEADRRPDHPKSCPTPGLVYAENTIDPARAKFYGDAQEKITAASTDLLFFQLELNRLDDARWKRRRAGPARALPALDRGPAPGKAATSSTTGSSNCSTKNRSPATPPGTGCSTRPSPALRFEIDGEEMTLEPALNLLQDPDEAPREKAAERDRRDAQGKSAHLLADLQRPRQGQGNLRPLARLQGCRGFAAPVQPRRARGGRRAWSRRCAPPIRACRTAITSSRRDGSARNGCATGTATRRCPTRPADLYSWDAGARGRARRLCAASRRAWRTSREEFFDDRWIDAPVRPGKAPGAFAHPTTPSRPSLCAAQLPGQAARRDDARA